jgi:hypothetical protein
MSDEDKKRKRERNNESVRKCRMNEKNKINKASEELSKHKQEYKELEEKYQALQKELQVLKSLFHAPAISSSTSDNNNVIDNNNALSRTHNETIVNRTNFINSTTSSNIINNINQIPDTSSNNNFTKTFNENQLDQFVNTTQLNTPIVITNNTIPLTTIAAQMMNNSKLFFLNSLNF